MKWTDVIDIAIALEECYSEKDNLNIRFTDLRQWILDLDNFKGKPDGCNEKILEAIQMAWIEERE